LQKIHLKAKIMAGLFLMFIVIVVLFYYYYQLIGYE